LTPPFTLPIEYKQAVQRLHENVDKLRDLISSDELDTNKKKSIDAAIQSKFKEWLTLTGNTRQILDLVQLEKSRSLSQ